MKKEDKKREQNHLMRRIAFFGILIFVVIVILSSKTPNKESSVQESQPNVMQPKEKPQEDIIEEPPVEEVVEEEPKVEVIEHPVKEEPPPIEPIPEEEPEEIAEEPKETIQGVCEDGYIDITLTNTFDEAFSTVGLTWWVSGKLSHNIACDKGILEPGESTFCPGVNSYKLASMRIVTVYLFKKPYSVTVDCGKFSSS